MMQRLRVSISGVVIVAAVGMVFGAPASAGPDPAATAESAITELTALLPDMFSVPSASAFADVPECDVATKAEALAAEKGDVVEQAYGAPYGGATARIIVFSKAKDAKRYFKLFTSARARVCITETHKAAAALGGDASTAEADLAKGRVPGVKPSVTFTGPITLGEKVVDDYEAYVRRGAVTIQVIAGVTPGTTDLAATLEQWVIDTAEQLG
jgi:hypothetical protein